MRIKVAKLRDDKVHKKPFLLSSSILHLIEGGHSKAVSMLPNTPQWCYSLDRTLDNGHDPLPQHFVIAF